MNDYSLWYVVLLENGEVDYINSSTNSARNYYFYAGSYFHRNNIVYHKNNVSVHCLAKDKEHALTIADKMRLRVIKENLWNKGLITFDEEFIIYNR